MIEILDFKYLAQTYLCLVVNNPDNKFSYVLGQNIISPAERMGSFYVGKSNIGGPNLLWLAVDGEDGIILYLEITK